MIVVALVVVGITSAATLRLANSRTTPSAMTRTKAAAGAASSRPLERFVEPVQVNAIHRRYAPERMLPVHQTKPRRTAKAAVMARPTYNVRVGNVRQGTCSA